MPKNFDFAAMFSAYNEQHQGHPQMHPSLQQPPPQQQPQQVPQVPQDVLMKLLELQQQQVRPDRFSASMVNDWAKSALWVSSTGHFALVLFFSSLNYS